MIRKRNDYDSRRKFNYSQKVKMTKKRRVCLKFGGN